MCSTTVPLGTLNCTAPLVVLQHVLHSMHVLSSTHCKLTPAEMGTCLTQSFEGREVRDVATSVPEDYVAPPAFATLALQHTNVKLTWDKDDDARKRTLAKRVTKDELRDDDFKVHL
jgi:hypothetical protein